MKLNRKGRNAAAAILSLVAALGFTSCSRDYTVGFLYVTSAAGTTGSPNGTISEYGIDYQTGSLIALSSSGQDTQGKNPVAIAITPNQKNVYVVNRDDSNIGEFTIGTDGKLYPQKITTVVGSFPTAIAVSPDEAYLYVTFTFQPGFNYTNVSPGPGGLEIFKLGAPVASGGNSGMIAIGAPVINPATGLNYFPLGFTPVSIAVGPNRLLDGSSPSNPTACTTAPTTCTGFVYVIDQDPSSFNNLLVFSRDIAGGSITPAPPGPNAISTPTSTAYLSGTLPSAVAVTPRGDYVYITDRTANQVIGYGVLGKGALTPLLTGPFATQIAPSALTIDPRGRFLYVTNFGSNSVSGFAINVSSGALSAAGAPAQIQGTGPNCVTVENALGRYLYTANFLDNTVSGQQLDSQTGNLVKIRNSPFPTGTHPTCAASIGNGDHATQVIQ